jgi:hypothetical protein
MALEQSGTGTTWEHKVKIPGRPREDNIIVGNHLKIRVNASFMTPTLLIVWGMFDRPIHTFSEIGGS